MFVGYKNVSVENVDLYKEGDSLTPLSVQLLDFLASRLQSFYIRDTFLFECSRRIQVSPLLHLGLCVCWLCPNLGVEACIAVIPFEWDGRWKDN